VAKIESGRWSEMLRRALGMAGQETVSAELSPEVSPTWTLEDNALEWGWLKNVRYCSVGTQQGGAGAAVSNVRLRNISGSNTLIIIDKIVMTVGATSAVHIMMSPTVDQSALTSIVTTGSQDARWGFQEAVLQVSSGNTAATGSWSLLKSTTPADTPVVFDSQIVLIPNTAVDVATGTVDRNFYVNVSWHERQLIPLEAGRPPE